MTFMRKNIFYVLILALGLTGANVAGGASYQPSSGRIAGMVIGSEREGEKVDWNLYYCNKYCIDGTVVISNKSTLTIRVGSDGAYGMCPYYDSWVEYAKGPSYVWKGSQGPHDVTIVTTGLTNHCWFDVYPGSKLIVQSFNNKKLILEGEAVWGKTGTVLTNKLHVLTRDDVEKVVGHGIGLSGERYENACIYSANAELTIDNLEV